MLHRGIIETREELFQVGNSLKPAPFRDKGQNIHDFPCAVADNHCLSDRNPFSGQIEATFPQIGAIPLTFFQGGYPHMEELWSFQQPLGEPAC
jgi:hypothetical protein